jgi:oxaloacetate decarboxylase gamma subunit
MTVVEMLQQSAILTILGMTVVFLFLWIMIICVTVTGKLIHKKGRDNRRPEQAAPKTANGGAAPAEVTAAISAAITEYRRQ